MKRIVITGASSGIGEAAARILATKGHELFLIARRGDKLESLKKSLGEEAPQSKVHLIQGDINDPKLGDKIATVTEKKVHILINNAGLALGREKVEKSNFSDLDVMIQTNITSNFRMVHLILPWMIAQAGGDIINLCSIAGHYTYQGGAVYCATKHAVNAFTRALREETCGQNIRVMQISPGMVNTEFSTVRFNGNRDMADAVYANMTPLSANDIAEMMLFMLERPRHVVIDEIITMPLQQGSPLTVHRNNP
jgi:3-hydroxy acid dehydrogenase/malonic semialdehyde reductase